MRFAVGIRVQQRTAQKQMVITGNKYLCIQSYKYSFPIKGKASGYSQSFFRIFLCLRTQYAKI